MAIKKKAILTDNTTLPTAPTVIPTITPTPPLLTNIIALPFGLAYKLPTQNVRNIPVLPDSTATRPSQNVGFDITITDLTQPKPMYLNDINGIFNLYSGTLADICSGLVPQFDLRYIQIRQQLNAQIPNPPLPNPPTPLIAGYPAGAILFSPTNLAWYLSLQNDNQDSSINSLTPTSTAWQKITDVASNLAQHGRLSGVTGKPYNDTPITGSPTLYFTPTEQGNLIALYNGNNWVTQPFNQVSLDVSLLNDTSLQATGSLTSLGSNTDVNQPSGVTVSPDGLNVYVVNYGFNNISAYRISGSGSNLTLTELPFLNTRINPIRIVVSPDGTDVYETDLSSNTISHYRRSSSDGSLSAIGSYTTGNQPYGIAISPSLTGISNVYDVDSLSNTVSHYNRNTSDGTLSPIRAVATGTNPTEIVISPDGTNVYITNNASFTVSQYSRDSGTGNLTAIGTPIATGNYPRGIVISPDGLNVYVANNSDDTISQYSRDLGTGILQALSPDVVTAGQYSNQLAISPDGLNVYVTNSYVTTLGGGDNTVWAYTRSLSTGQLTYFATIGTGYNPIQIAITPDGKNAFVTNFGYNSNPFSLSYYSRQLPTAPKVRLTQPSRTSNVSVYTTITLTFSEAVNGVSLSTIKLQIGSQTSIATSISVNGNSYTINYPTPLTGSTQYSVIVKSGITSVASGLAVVGITFNFTTVDTSVPTVSLTSPTTTTNVSLTPLVQLTFSEAVIGVSPSTVNFAVLNGTPITITITNSGNNVYTINLPTSLLLATNYTVNIINNVTNYIRNSAGTKVAAITFGFSTTFPLPNLYDIFVGNNSSNVLTLAQDQFTGSTGTGTNRQQLANGKWVNLHTITTTTPNIPPNQGLLVGSIAVSTGVVQSWNGYRGIFNLYNQVTLGLLAYQNPATVNPVPNSWKWNYNSTTAVRNQNANSIAGQGNFYFLIDLLYNQDFTCEYNGGGYFTAVGDNGTVGIALNPTTTLTPLVNFTYGGLSGSAGIVPFNLSYGYQFNNVSTTQLPIGLNLLQKVESGVGYFSDNIGLTAIYYG